MHYQRYFFLKKRVFPPYLELNTLLGYKIKKKLFNELPIELTDLASKMPLIGNKEL